MNREKGRRGREEPVQDREVSKKFVLLERGPQMLIRSKELDAFEELPDKEWEPTESGNEQLV
jgi:hypothetical protein